MASSNSSRASNAGDQSVHMMRKAVAMAKEAGVESFVEFGEAYIAFCNGKLDEQACAMAQMKFGKSGDMAE